MISHPGALGTSKHQRTMNPQPVLTQDGIAKASRNRKIFNRALHLIEKEFGYTREEALAWLDDDANDTWIEYNEANPSQPI